MKILFMSDLTDAFPLHNITVYLSSASSVTHRLEKEQAFTLCTCVDV
jgi:hypothetical protein